MTINHIIVDFKPLYIPFDYSFPPCKEYIPPAPFLDQDLPLESLEAAKNAENLLAPELFE